MRERFILNVAGLRYEFDLIAVLTSLPPEARSKIAVLPPSDGKRKTARRIQNAGVAGQ
jgi:hypothetical protein